MSAPKQPEKGTHILISGIVSGRDKRPYVHVDVGGRLVQLSIADARNIALDLFRACSYAEADAMILKFFDKQEYPEGAAAALMVEFREFRHELDTENVERTTEDPDK